MYEQRKQLLLDMCKDQIAAALEDKELLDLINKKKNEIEVTCSEFESKLNYDGS